MYDDVLCKAAGGKWMGKAKNWAKWRALGEANTTVDYIMNMNS